MARSRPLTWRRPGQLPFRAPFLAVVIRAVSPWVNISTQTLSLTVSSAPPMARSSLSTHPVRQVAAPVPSALPHRVRRWDRTPTRTLFFTASCVHRSRLPINTNSSRSIAGGFFRDHSSFGQPSRALSARLRPGFASPCAGCGPRAILKFRLPRDPGYKSSC